MGRAGAVVLTLLVTAIGAAPAQARSLRFGIFDGSYLRQDAGSSFDRTAQAGADVVRLSAAWAAIAPQRPANPTDPADPAYRWQSLDAAVQGATSRGLDPVVLLGAAPRWAEGPGRPASAQEGTWRPAADAFGAFARAAATRYSGRAGLPRVRAWQAWNEPNLPNYLTPQWKGRGSHARPVSPGIYRRLVNAFYDGVKSVDSSNLVVAGNTAPFGDPRGTGPGRTAPALFDRELLSAPTRFDVLAHHPYGVRGPFSPAYNDDDVTVADMGKLSKILERAVRSGDALPRKSKRLWVTEVSWDSKPDPNGLSQATQARWLAEAMYVLWRAGVDTVLWYKIVDDPPDPSYNATNQSGLYQVNGRPKASLRAYMFPLVARRTGSRTLLWTRAPAAGRIAFQVRRGSRWSTVARATASRRGIVTRKLRLPGDARVRAQLGDATSLTVSAR